MAMLTVTRYEAELLSLIRKSPDPGEAFLLAAKTIQSYLEGVGTVTPLTLTVPTDTEVSDKYDFFYSRFCKME